MPRRDWYRAPADEYRRQGNALCTKGKAELDALPKPKPEDGFVDYVEKVEFKLLKVIALRARPVRRELGLDKCIELEVASDAG